MFARSDCYDPLTMACGDQLPCPNAVSKHMHALLQNISMSPSFTGPELSFAQRTFDMDDSGRCSIMSKVPNVCYSSGDPKASIIDRLSSHIYRRLSDRFTVTWNVELRSPCHLGLCCCSEVEIRENPNVMSEL